VARGHPMNAYSSLADLFRRRPNKAKAAADLRQDAEQPARLVPPLDAEAQPPGFEDALEVQALGYRDRLAMVLGQRRRARDPVWTLVRRDW
jgi:hypothetical protein